MDERERQRRAQEAREMAVLRSLAGPYRAALDDLAPARMALLDAVKAAPDGTMNGREVASSAAFAAFLRAAERPLAGFAATADVIAQTGVRQAVLEARDDALALILETVHPADRERARTMLATPSDDEMLALVGL